MENILKRFSHNNSKINLTSVTALTLYRDELLDGCLFSYIDKLDEILQNVLIPKRIIEFTGHFECTTPICLQLCISVQVPKKFGGLNGEAFYISTNGNFSIERLTELAAYFIDVHSRNIPELNIKSILNCIHYTKLYNIVQLMSCIFQLESFLKEKKIRLVVIDSITFILRQLEVPERFKSLNIVFQMLANLAEKYSIIVILTNFCTTRINGNEAYTVGSFGDSFYHLVNSRLIFSRTNSFINVKLTKSLMCSEKEIYFEKLS